MAKITMGMIGCIVWAIAAAFVYLAIQQVYGGGYTAPNLGAAYSPMRFALGSTWNYLFDPPILVFFILIFRNNPAWLAQRDEEYVPGIKIEYWTTKRVVQTAVVSAAYAVWSALYVPGLPLFTAEPVVNIFTAIYFDPIMLFATSWIGEVIRMLILGSKIVVFLPGVFTLVMGFGMSAMFSPCAWLYRKFMDGKPWSRKLPLYVVFTILYWLMHLVTWYFGFMSAMLGPGLFEVAFFTMELPQFLAGCIEMVIGVTAAEVLLARVVRRRKK